MIEHEQNRIRKHRQDFKLSQREFALTTGIPLGTVRNWEQEKCSPPEYLYGMLYELLRRNSMLNVKTLKVVALLNELAEKEKNGIREFKNAEPGIFDRIIILYAEYQEKYYLHLLFHTGFER